MMTLNKYQSVEEFQKRKVNKNIHLFIIKSCAKGQKFHKKTQFSANLAKSNPSDQKGDDDCDSLDIKNV
jgi:hypothetical protein